MRLIASLSHPATPTLDARSTEPMTLRHPKTHQAMIRTSTGANKSSHLVITPTTQHTTTTTTGQCNRLLKTFQTHQVLGLLMITDARLVPLRTRLIVALIQHRRL